MSTSLPYRPNVCMLVTNAQRLIFLGERAGSPGIWQLPQGGVEMGESLAENALRETHEEIGVELRQLRVIKQLNASHRYDFTDPPHYAIGKWRGQEQTFWILEFLGADTDIKLDRFHPEFTGYRWCTPQEIRQLAEPRRRPGYEAPLIEFEAWLKSN